MSSRFPPPNPGDQRYAPRDRSPPRFAERRASTQHGGSLGSRAPDPGSRNLEDNGPPNLNRDLHREPPRGPKGFVDGPRGGGHIPGGPRGRGFAGRGDFRDRDRERERDFRESRDLRDDAPFRRENDRDWPRRDRDFEARESRPSPPARARSRTPPGRGFRDLRDGQPRDLDLSRIRRDSRDAPLSATSTASDPPISTGGGFTRGGFRGRGRGDWDFRGRGRGTFLDDREGYRARSGSQDRRWDRDLRDDRERERVADRRDEERKLPDWVERERDAERWKREQGVNRVESRNPSGSSTAPSTPLAPSAGNLHPSGTDRSALKDGFLGPVSDRRASSVVVSSAANRDIRRDVERSDYFSSRAEASRERYGQRASSPPPQAPQVPAFGSVTYRSMPGAGFGTNVWRASKDERSSQVSTVPKAVPTGPKAQVTLQAPTGPRADHSVDRRQTFESKDQVNHGTNNPRFKDIHHPSRTESTPAMISATAHVADINSNPPWGPRGPDTHAPSTAPLRATPSAAQATPRPAPSSSPQPSIRPSYTTPVRAVTPGGPPGSASAATPNGSTTSPRPPNTNIPTGPRAGRTIPPSRPQPQSRPTAPSALLAQGSPKAHQWVRSAPPKYPKVPSIMNTVPAKRDRAGDEKDRMSRTISSVTRAEPPPWGGTTGHEIPRPDSQAPKPSDQVCRNLSPAVKKEELLNEAKNSPVSGTSSKDKPTMTGPGSIGLSFDSDGSSDEANDDDDMDLDEEDFADSESRFSREMAILEAKKPAAPRYGTTRVMEILKIISLEDLAENYGKPVVVTGGVSADVANATRQSHTGLPSPERDNSSDVEMEDAASALREVPMNRIPTPAIESLPFLNPGPPTPFSELGVVQENISSHEKVKEAIRAEILKQRNQVAKKHKQLRQEYAALYKPWRMMVQELDNKKKEEKTITPAPTSPATATSPIVASAPAIEGRRGGKFGTEFDLQRVLRETELAAKEAAEKEEREAKAKTDTEKEAKIPDMLDEFEAEAGVFKDTNQFVDAKLALGVFAFVPPVDDFTPEEQKTFTENFLAYPKKWGKIAEALPGRDYKQCIEHYYLTKEEAKYKVKLNRRWSKKGRRAGRAPQSRPKSNALMSDLGVHPEMYDGDEPEAPAIAVTDTGRPKRAAAPTFGDNAVETDPTPIPTPGRKPVATKGEVNLESSVERPTPKRTKTAQPREKGQKRGKAPLLAAAPGPSPQKSDREGSRGRSREPKIEDEQKAKDLEVASSLASLLAGPVTTQVSQSESWFAQAQPLAGHSETARQQQQQQQKPASQTSSYWSVPEQTDFIKLLAHFGTDWPAIANWMKSKTHTMAKNYYFRLVEHGRTDLEDMAQEADDKRRRGEPLGPPPPPTVVQKRRYEITPQSAQHRPLAPNSDVMEVEDLSPNVAHAVPIQGSPQQYNQVPPRLATLAQAAPVPTLAISQPPFQKSVQAANQVQLQAQQKVPQGPRIGFFPDDRKDSRLSGQIQSMSQQQQQQQLQQQQPQLKQQQQQQQLEQQQLQAQLEQQRQHRLEQQQRQQQLIEQRQRQQQLLEQQQRQQQLEQQHQQQLEQQRLQRAEQQRQQQSEQQRQQMQQQLQQLEQDRAARIQQRAQESQSRYPQTLQNQQQLPVQHHPTNQPTKSVAALQSRSGPSEAIQIEPRPRLNLHPQHTEPPTPLRRLDSYEQQKQYMQSPIRSPAVAGPVVAPLSARDEPRPSPLPGGVIAPELTRPPQVPVKRSNIMSILNDEPTEPSPRKRISDQKVLAPTPPSHSPAPQNVRYHPPQPQSQQSQHTVRKDAPIDQPVVQSQQRPSFGMPNQPQPQQTAVRTYPELTATWPAVVHSRTYYDPRPTYQPQRVPSPQVQGAHVQPSRPTYQHARAASPAPPVFNSHSRSSSYTQTPHQQPAPSYPLQQSSYAAGPQHQQLHHHAPTQHLPLLQAQQQQQQQIQQQQQQTSSLRQGMAYPQDMQQQRMQQDQLRQHQQQQQQQQQQLQLHHEQARQDQVRREQQAQAGGRTFTPPAGGDYRPSPYGVPVPRGYQERR